MTQNWDTPKMEVKQAVKVWVGWLPLREILSHHFAKYLHAMELKLIRDKLESPFPFFISKAPGKVPYQGYFCGNQNMGRGKLADRLSPSQTYFSKTQDWNHQKSEQPCWTEMCGGHHSSSSGLDLIKHVSKKVQYEKL